MKKFLVLLILSASLFVPFSGQGQVLISILFGEQLNSGKMEFGLVGGFNYSTMPGLEDPQYKRSFGLGLFLDYKFNDHWIGMVETNVKTSIGSQNLKLPDFPYPTNDTIISASTNTQRNLEVIHVPVFISYRLTNRLGFGGGFYASILHGTRDVVLYKQGNYDMTFERSFTGFVNRMDFGLTGAVHFHFLGNPGIQIRGKINYGLVDVFKGTAGVSSKNLWYSVAVAVPIMIKL